MKSLEHCVLRIADNDMTWFGLNWLRPAKQKRLGPGYIVSSSILLGLPGVFVGAGLIYLAFGQVTPGVWLGLFVLVTTIELTLHILFARFWNRRAGALVHDGKTAESGSRGD
jgi:hypothetical protein